MHFSTISAAAAAMALLPAGALAQANGCSVEIINSNQAVVGSGCALFGGVTNIKDNRGRNWGVSANQSCGLSVVQRLPDGWSVRQTGVCKSF